MNHIQLTEDFRKTLLESSNWDKVGLSFSDTEEVVQEVVEEGKKQNAEVVEAPQEDENYLLEALSEEQEEILNVIVEESLNADIFFHLFERFASVLDASDHINENYDEYDESEVMAAALCEVFPDQFSYEEEAEEAKE